MVNEFFVRVQAVGLSAPDQQGVGAERREIVATIIGVVFDGKSVLLLLFRF
jgi:hypothetical protein